MVPAENLFEAFVFLGHCGMEERRVIRRDGNGHACFGQQMHGMMAESGVNSQGDIGSGADLEDGSTIAELLDQSGVFGAAYAVADALDA